MFRRLFLLVPFIAIAGCGKDQPKPETPPPTTEAVVVVVAPKPPEPNPAAEATINGLDRVSEILLRMVETQAEATVKKMKGVAIRDVSHLNKGQPIVTVSFYSMDVGAVEFSKFTLMPKFYRLTFVQCKNTDKALKQAEVLQQITSLSVENSDVTDAGLESIVKLPNLKLLDLSGVNRVTKTGWKTLSVSNLEQLHLSSTTIDDDGIRELAGLPNLTELWLDKTSATLAGCGPAFASWKKLKELTVAESPISNEGVAAIAQAKTLLKLNMQGSTISDAGMKPLGKLFRLKELDLSETTKITGKGFDELSDLNALETIHLAGSGITDSGMKSLSEMRNVQNLDLDRTKITDAGLKFLATNRGLLELSVQETSATNAAITDIAVAAKKLKKISVRKSMVTKAVIDELKKMNIDLFIDFD